MRISNSITVCLTWCVLSIHPSAISFADDGAAVPVDQALADREQRREDARKTIAELTEKIQGTEISTPEVYAARARAYFVTGQFDLAFKDYTEAIEMTPDEKARYSLYQGRTGAAVLKGDYRQGLADARKLVELEPNRSEPYALVALILAKSPDKSVKDPVQAIQIAKQAADYQFHFGREEAFIQKALAAAYAANGNFTLAVQHQEKAIAELRGRPDKEMAAELEAYQNKQEYPFPRPR